MHPMMFSLIAFDFWKTDSKVDGLCISSSWNEFCYFKSVYPKENKCDYRNNGNNN